MLDKRTFDIDQQGQRKFKAKKDETNREILLKCLLVFSNTN